MKIKAGVNFHNRFDIVKNGEWVGYAENIILDQMYSRVCNFLGYFINIHFGTGSGTPTPERTSLFTHLGTKSAVLEETIKALPTSKVTKKIVINPEEYVDEEITEVGIAYGSATSSLVTHAMIKDAEGNPLSINKTDLDVVEIYATIFITLIDSANTFFYKYSVENNLLINYLVDGTTKTNYFICTNSNADGNMKLHYYNSMVAVSGTADVVNRKVVFNNRYAINQMNGDAIRGVCLLDFVEADALTTNFQITNKTVGVGDGATKRFVVGLGEISQEVFKIDGAAESNYSLSRNENYGLSHIRDYAVANENNPDFDSPVYDYRIRQYREDTIYSNYVINIAVDPIKIAGNRLVVCCEHASVSRETSMSMTESTDGITYTSIGSHSSAAENYPTEGFSDTIGEGINFLRINVTTSAPGFYSPKVNGIAIWDAGAIVEFVDAPPVDSLITLDCSVPYYPKDENYVMDVEFEIQFGEGV